MRTIWRLRKVRWGLGILAALFFIFLVAGELYFSKHRLVEAYIALRQDKNQSLDDLKAYWVWADTGDYVTLEEAKYATITPISAKEAEQLKKELLSADETAPFYVTKVGKRLGLFADYRIAMQPMRLTLRTNLSDMDLLLNGKKVARSTSDKFSYTVERLPQASYEAGLTGVFEGKRLKVTKNYQGNEILDLFVQLRHFTVTSNLLDGDIFVGDKRVATLSEGRYEVTNFPQTEDLDVRVKKVFADGDISSSPMRLSQIADDSEVDLQVTGLLEKDKATEFLLAAFTQLTNYATTRSDSGDVASLFEGGATNGFYRALKTSSQTKLQTDSRLASGFSIPNLWLNSIRQVGKTSYALDYGVVYDYYYDKTTDPNGKTQGHLLQTFGGVATLKKVGDTYLFETKGHSDVTLLSEDNQVKPVSVFPEEALGTWQAKSLKAKASISLTLEADGTVIKTITYDDKKKASKTYTAKVKSLTKLADGFYRYEDYTGDSQALMTGSSLGTATYGFAIASGQLRLVFWQSDQDVSDGLWFTKK